MADETVQLLIMKLSPTNLRGQKKFLLIAFNINLNYNTFHLIAITCG